VIAVIPFAKKLRKLMPHGYTISEFISARYGGAKLARIVVVAGILFGAIQIITVNLKGASLMVATIFGLPEGVVATISAIVILIYISLGGLWASMSTSTLMCLLIMVPSVLVTTAILGHVGGAEAVWQVVQTKGDNLLSVTLFTWTRLSMVVAAVISIAVVLSGIDLVTLVLGTSIIRAAVLVPLMLSILWSRMNARAFTWGTIIGLIAGVFALAQFGEEIGTYTVLTVSTIVPILIALTNTEQFDYASLNQVQDISEVPEAQTSTI
jgi:Na+/proline symporter